MRERQRQTERPPQALSLGACSTRGLGSERVTRHREWERSSCERGATRGLPLPGSETPTATQAGSPGQTARYSVTLGRQTRQLKLETVKHLFQVTHGAHVGAPGSGSHQNHTVASTGVLSTSWWSQRQWHRQPLAWLPRPRSGLRRPRFPAGEELGMSRDSRACGRGAGTHLQHIQSDLGRVVIQWL